MGVSLNKERVCSDTEFYWIILISHVSTESRRTCLTGFRNFMINCTSGGMAKFTTEFNKKCGIGMGRNWRAFFTKSLISKAIGPSIFFLAHSVTLARTWSGKSDQTFLYKVSGVGSPRRTTGSPSVAAAFENSMPNDPWLRQAARVVWMWSRERAQFSLVFDVSLEETRDSKCLASCSVGKNPSSLGSLRYRRSSLFVVMSLILTI